MWCVVRDVGVERKIEASSCCSILPRGSCLYLHVCRLCSQFCFPPPYSSFREARGSIKHMPRLLRESLCIWTGDASESDCFHVAHRLSRSKYRIGRGALLGWSICGGLGSCSKGARVLRKRGVANVFLLSAIHVFVPNRSKAVHRFLMGQFSYGRS